jgi:mono/diheme cytochrome c family protein
VGRPPALVFLVVITGAMWTRPLLAQSSSTRSTWDSVYTAEQALRGQEIYDQECSLCHGPQLNGIDAAPGLTGGRFTSNWNGVNLNDMVERIRVSMPASAPGKLSRQQVADVLAYVFSVNGFPVGQTELPRQSGMLRTITFAASKR